MTNFIAGLRGYRFGVFEVDLRAGEIRRNGLKVKLQNQPFQVLVMLLEHSPDAVLRDELRKELWNGDTFVDFDHSLSIAMNKIREALGDSAENARFIETLPRRGYRFVATVERVLSPTTASFPQSEGTSPHGALAAPNFGNDRSNTVASADQVERSETMVSENPNTGIFANPQESLASARQTKKRWLLYAGLSCPIIIAAYLAPSWKNEAVKRPPPYTQLTNFTDSAFGPAISPDGRVVAFIRGTPQRANLTRPGQVYAKLLPEGESVPLSKDDRIKYGLAFSPDGSRIYYTVTDPDRWGWDTVTISAFGGEPTMFLLNAAGLSWRDKHRILFSEVKEGTHMGIVTATDTRAESHDVYLPQHERAMAPLSYASPDRKSVLVVEKDRTGTWEPCRVVPLDGAGQNRQVGPAGECTSGAWSPDGVWMYFSVVVNGFSQIWRQRFPEGNPEQITFGPAEAEGVAVLPDGRSLITSIGMRQSILLVRDAQGERTVSTEGDASFPSFSEDGKRVFYLLRRQSKGAANELWTTDLSSGKSVCVVPELPITRYNVSRDGREVVFAVKPGNQSQIWLSSTDRLTPARQLASIGDDRPLFGPDGELLFRRSEEGRNYLFQMNRDGFSQRKVFPNPINQVQSISPDRRWVAVVVPLKGAATAVVAIPTQGGEAKQLCPGICQVRWSLDGKSFYFKILDNNTDYRDKALAVPVQQGELPPNFPPTGFRSMAEAMAQTRGRLVDIPSAAEMLQFVPGPETGSFAYIKATDHRNLFRVPLE